MQIIRCLKHETDVNTNLTSVRQLFALSVLCQCVCMCACVRVGSLFHFSSHLVIWFLLNLFFHFFLLFSQHRSRLGIYFILLIESLVWKLASCVSYLIEMSLLYRYIICFPSNSNQQKNNNQIGFCSIILIICLDLYKSNTKIRYTIHTYIV